MDSTRRTSSRRCGAITLRLVAPPPRGPGAAGARRPAVAGARCRGGGCRREPADALPLAVRARVRGGRRWLDRSALAVSRFPSLPIAETGNTGNTHPLLHPIQSCPSNYSINVPSISPITLNVAGGACWASWSGTVRRLAPSDHPDSFAFRLLPCSRALGSCMASP